MPVVELPSPKKSDKKPELNIRQPELPVVEAPSKKTKKSKPAESTVRELDVPDEVIPTPKLRETERPVAPVVKESKPITIGTVQEELAPFVESDRKMTEAAKTETEDKEVAPEQNVVTAQILNPTFNLRTQPNIKSKSRGLVGKVIGKNFEIDTSANNPDWVRVTTSSGSGWVNRQAFKPARIKGDFIIRSEPSLSGGKRLGLVKEALNTDDLVVTGRQKTTGSGARTNTFMEVIYKGKPAWIHSTAFLDEAPEEALVTSTTPSTNEKPEAKPESKGSKPEAKESPVAELTPASSTRPPSRYSRCVSTKAALDRNEELQKALIGSNPFTTWYGPWGSRVIVREDGTATLKHPLKGDIPLKASVCMDSKKAPYLSVNGQVVYLQGPKLEMATFTQDGTQYKFKRAVK